MGWTFVSKAHGGTGVVNLNLTVTLGDLIVLFWCSDSGSTGTFTASDTSSNSYSLVDHVNSDRPSTQGIRFAIANATGTFTITVSGSIATDIFQCANFSHDGGTIPGTFVSNKATSTGSTSVTTTLNDSLLIGFGDASSANNAGSGFTIIWQDVSANRITSEYKLTNTAGSNTINLVDGSPHRSILGVAFNPPGVAATRLPVPVVRSQAVKRAAFY